MMAVKPQTRWILFLIICLLADPAGAYAQAKNSETTVREEAITFARTGHFQLNETHPLDTLPESLRKAGLRALQNAETAHMLPIKLRGYWARPDCAQPEATLILTRNYALHTDGVTALLEELRFLMRGSDQMVLEAPWSGEIYAARLTNDGLLKYASPRMPADSLDTPRPLDWKTGDDSRIREYTRCAREFLSWPNMHRSGVWLMDWLDPAVHLCGHAPGAESEFSFYRPQQVDPMCLPFLTSIFDRDGDEILRLDEALFAGETIGYLHAAMGRAKASIQQEVRSAPLKGRYAAQLLWTGALLQLDWNQDNLLQKAEMQVAPLSPQNYAGGQTLKAMLQDLARFFPVLEVLSEPSTQARKGYGSPE